MGQKLYEHQGSERQPVNVNKQHAAERLSLNDRIAVFVSRNVGSMFCAYLFALLGIASLIAVFSGNDFLALIFGAFSSYFLQLVLLPILALGQNILGRHAELQAEEQFTTTQRTFRDTVELIGHLHAQDDVLLKMQQAQLSQDDLLMRALSTLSLVLDQLGIDAAMTTDHKLPVVRMGHKTQVDEDDLLVTLTRTTGIKPEIVAALPLELKLALERNRPKAERVVASEVVGNENLYGMG